MKGLIRNNFYNVLGSFKLMLILGIVLLLAIIIFAVYFPTNDSLISVLIGGILGGAGGLTMSAIQKDSASKWNKFELTMPIDRRDVIKARYISFLLYIIIAIVLSILSVTLFHMISGYINLERVGFGFTFGIAFALSLPTFMTPLILIFGEDKNEGIMMISVVLTLGLFIGSSALLTPFLSDFSNANLIFRLGYLISSTVLFIVSYFLSRHLYINKEF